MLHSFSIKTASHEELADITSQVQNTVNNANIKDGICIVYCPHTTAAITINENADPTVPRDILKGLSSFKLENISFSHKEGNSPSHIKSSLVGCSETILIENGKLKLGTWQGIFFCEFDGPRTRKVLVKIMK